MEDLLMIDDFKPGFFRTLVLLRDYLPVIVIGGGWAPLTYGSEQETDR